MDKTAYNPTEDEEITIERAGMSAALVELQPLKHSDQNVSMGVLACLRAFKAARNARFAATIELLSTKPGHDYVAHYASESDMVCSAFAAMMFDLDASQCSPRSIAGSQIATLFNAAKALEAMSVVYSAFDDNNEVFGTYLADETTALAEASLHAPLARMEM